GVCGGGGAGEMGVAGFGGRSHGGGERGVFEALPPFWGGGLKTPPPHTNLNVAMDEDDHALEHVAGLGQIRRVPRMSLSIDIFQGDLAAGLPVIHDEALGLVPREAGILVLVVVQHVAAALEPDRRRSFDLLATFECEHAATLRHISLAAPIGVLARDDGLRPRRLEEAYNEHCERMQERKHRARSCDDSTRRCDSQAGWDFRKGQVEATLYLRCKGWSGRLWTKDMLEVQFVASASPR